MSEVEDLKKRIEAALTLCDKYMKAEEQFDRIIANDWVPLTPGQKLVLRSCAGKIRSALLGGEVN